MDGRDDEKKFKKKRKHPLPKHHHRTTERTQLLEPELRPRVKRNTIVIRKKKEEEKKKKGERTGCRLLYMACPYRASASARGSVSTYTGLSSPTTWAITWGVVCAVVVGGGWWVRVWNDDVPRRPHYMYPRTQQPRRSMHTTAVNDRPIAPSTQQPHVNPPTHPPTHPRSTHPGRLEELRTIKSLNPTLGSFTPNHHPTHNPTIPAIPPAHPPRPP